MIIHYKKNTDPFVHWIIYEEVIAWWRLQKWIIESYPISAYSIEVGEVTIRESMRILTFERKEDAALFKLFWQEFFV